MRRLNLDSCIQITDLSLKSLSDGCNNLTHINISWCDNITENGVEALARGCPKLRSFISKGVLQLTDKAVRCLAHYCQQLQVCNLQGCGVSLIIFICHGSIMTKIGVGSILINYYFFCSI